MHVGLVDQRVEERSDRRRRVAEDVLDARGLELRDEERTIINVKDDALRISFSFFTTEEEIERAVHAIAKRAGARAAA